MSGSVMKMIATMAAVDPEPTMVDNRIARSTAGKAKNAVGCTDDQLIDEASRERRHDRDRRGQHRRHEHCRDRDQQRGSDALEDTWQD